METLIEEDVHVDALRSFERNEHKIKVFLQNLQVQLGYYVSENEFDLLNICRAKWIANWDKYETDESYMNYMFISMKNEIRTIRKTESRYKTKHKCGPESVTNNNNTTISLIRVWNEMAVSPEDGPREILQMKELTMRITNRLLEDQSLEVFMLMAEGNDIKDISQQLGISVTKVTRIKKEIIWPIMREVMQIPDSKYEVLIDNGRIYSNS